MSDDFPKLGIGIDSSEAVKGAENLDKLVDSSKNAEKATKGLGKQFDDIKSILNTINTSINKLATTQNVAIKNTETLSKTTKDTGEVFSKTDKFVHDYTNTITGADKSTKDFDKSIEKTGKDLNKIGKDTENYSNSSKKIQSQTNKNTQSTINFGDAIRKIAAPLAAYLGTRQIYQASEAWLNLTNRLRVITNTNEELITTQEEVFQIAQRSRQPIESTAEVYQRLYTNAEALNISGAKVARVVETVNKSMAISGVSGASASAAMVQLGQAFASGTLRGDELNSVLEQAPALAKTLADAFGVTVGQLRNLGSQGKITSKAVVEALLQQTDAVDAQFNKMQATGGQATAVLENSFIRMVGKINEGTGATTLFSGTLLSVANFLDSGKFTNGIIDSFNTWDATISQAKNNLVDLSNEVQLLGDIGTRSGDILTEAFKDFPANIKAFVEIATVEVAAELDKIKAQAKYTKEFIAAIFTDDTQAAAQQRYEKEIARIEGIRKESIEYTLKERDATIASAEAEKIKRQEAQKTINAKLEADKKLAAEAVSGAKKENLNISTTSSSQGVDALLKSLAVQKDAVDASFKQRQDQLKTFLTQQNITKQQYYDYTLLNLRKYHQDEAKYDQNSLQLKQQYVDQEGQLQQGAYQLQLDNLNRQRANGLISYQDYQNQYEALTQQNADKLIQIENNSYDLQLKQLETARQAKIDSIVPYDQLEQQLREQHEQKLTKISNKGTSDRQKFEQLSAKEKTKFVLNQLIDMTAGVASSNRKMFEINKIASIANATINTYEGVTKALAAYPPPISFIMAAAQLAAGIAQVSAIQSQSFSSSKPSTTVNTATTTGATTSVTNNASANDLANQAPQKAAPIFNIYGDIKGNDAEKIFNDLVELVNKRDYVFTGLVSGGN